jgi:hypothetical protein
MIIVSDELVKDGTGFLWSNAAQCVSYFDATPSLLRALMGETVFSEAPIQVATVGAEALDPNVVDSFYRAIPNSKLVNAYGPTEAAIGVAFAEMSKNMATTPIGGPVYNTKLSLCLGELLIGGVQVGHGYLNLPGKTSSSFVAGENDRVYLSGDLVRQDATGDFHYLRRRGMQVKVRGFRVELGEIESVGKAVEGVGDFAVVGVPDRSGRIVGLVGFYVEKEAARCGGVQTRLAEALDASLPPYMVPQRYIILEALPQTVSMKLDRKRLAIDAVAHVNPPKETIGGRSSGSDVQKESLSSNCKRMAHLWHVVLNLDSAGFTPDTSFLDVGGDSISAIRLVSAVRDANPGVAFTVNDVLDNPTLHGMAEKLSNLQSCGELDTVEIVSMSSSISEQNRARGYGQVSEEHKYLLKVRQSRSKDVIVCFPGFGWLGGEFQQFSNIAVGFTVFIAQLIDSRMELVEVARSICREIVHLDCESVILVGHSMGGLVACEVVSELRKVGCGRTPLVLIDTHSPHYEVPAMSDTDIRVAMDQLLGRGGSEYSTVKQKFMTNAKAMNRWETSGQMPCPTEYDAMIRVGVCSTPARDKHPERSYLVVGADHHSILRMPYVSSVVRVIRMLRDAGD